MPDTLETRIPTFNTSLHGRTHHPNHCCARAKASNSLVRNTANGLRPSLIHREQVKRIRDLDNYKTAKAQLDLLVTAAQTIKTDDSAAINDRWPTGLAS